MNLSDAIRLGSQMSKSTSGLLFRVKNEELRSCALGAALLGIGYIDDNMDSLYYVLKREFPFLRGYEIDNHLENLNQVWWWNDHGTSREEIANRVEEYEKKYGYWEAPEKSEDEIVEETLQAIQASINEPAKEPSYA